MQHKIYLRMGVVGFAAAWFQTAGHDPLLLARDGVRRLSSFLEEFGEVVCSDVVTNCEAARRMAALLVEKSVDVALICFPAWSHDEPVMTLAAGVGRLPLWIVDMHTYVGIPANVHDQAVFFAHTEMVGLLQGNAALKRCGFDAPLFKIDIVRNGNASSSLADALRAFAAAKSLRGGKIGILESRTDSIRCSSADEMAVTRHFGCTLERIPLRELSRAAECIADSERSAYVALLSARFQARGCNLDSEPALRSAQVALAIANICRQRRLDALAFDDLSDQLHETFGLRPCMLVRDILGDCPPIAPEGDVLAAIGMLILERVSALPVAVAEPFFILPENGSILFGHAGGWDPRLGDDKTVLEPDLEYLHSGDRFPGSPSIMVNVMPGPITLVNLYVDASGGRMLVVSGEALSHERKLPGYSEVLVHPTSSPRQLMRWILSNGLHQHFAFCRADCIRQLHTLCGFLSLSLLGEHSSEDS